MLERIRNILVEFVEVPKESITEETTLVGDLGLSSLDVMDIVVAFEEEFEVEIPDRKVLEIVTVSDMIQVLQEEYGLS